jgi:signal transduction histidine kinase
VRLRFVVSDTGIGLDRASRRRLFRPFAQADAEIAHRYGGAGLGLVAVKRIADAMGGGLAVTSAPGKGSRFRLDVVVALADSGKEIPSHPSR